MTQKVRKKAAASARRRCWTSAPHPMWKRAGRHEETRQERPSDTSAPAASCQDADEGELDDAR
jgi:hypothetical protein